MLSSSAKKTGQQGEQQMARHPAATGTYEEWLAKAADYRARGLGEMLKYAEKQAQLAYKAKRFSKKEGK